MRTLFWNTHKNTNINAILGELIIENNISVAVLAEYEANLDELIQIQYELLKTAYQLLKKGGVMVYSTCTLNKKENRKNIDRFLNEFQDMKLIEDRTILPYEYHSDGFYMARLVKE